MVEWKKLGDICSNVFAGGTPSTKHEDYYDGDIPWIRSGEIDFNVLQSSERNITQKGYDNSSAKLIRKGSVVMAMTGATVAKSAIVEFETSANQSVCALETDEAVANYKYLFYCLSKDYFIIRSSAQGALTSLNLAMIKQIEIPIPSISEQNRIVGILDTFTAAIDNLKEQIAQRRKQYEYYRDQLLDLEGKEGVEMKTLGEIGEVCMCKRIMKDQTSETGDVPFFKIGTFGGTPDAYISRDLYDTYKTLYSFPKKGDILLSASGTIGRKVVYDGEDAYFQDSNIVWIDNGEKVVTNPFLYYVYNTIEWKVDGGTIKRLYNYNLKSARIPVPPHSEQSRIVSILDTFEASIQNLQAQLAQREKQYEYYRNKLLTFE